MQEKIDNLKNISGVWRIGGVEGNGKKWIPLGNSEIQTLINNGFTVEPSVEHNFSRKRGCVLEM